MQTHVHAGTLALTKAGEADRKSHLSNAAEEHLEQAEEEETRVELALGNAVGVQMGAQEQGGRNEGNDASLHKQFLRQCCCHIACDVNQT